MLGDLRHHYRFLLSFAIGLLAGLIIWWAPVVDRLLVFSFTFSLVYLLITAALTPTISADFLRGRADLEDEGMWLIALIAVGSVVISLIAIWLSIREPAGLTLRPFLALLSVPMGWAMVHTVMAFHYASLWYAKAPDGHEVRNLGFPGIGPDQDADLWDFLYYSFTLGMAAQTADVTAMDTRARRLTLMHSGFSFFYNTVLLALALNAAMSLGQ